MFHTKTAGPQLPPVDRVAPGVVETATFALG